MNFQPDQSTLQQYLADALTTNQPDVTRLRRLAQIQEQLVSVAGYQMTFEQRVKNSQKTKDRTDLLASISSYYRAFKTQQAARTLLNNQIKAHVRNEVRLDLTREGLLDPDDRKKPCAKKFKDYYDRHEQALSQTAPVLDLQMQIYDQEEVKFNSAFKRLVKALPKAEEMLEHPFVTEGMIAVVVSECGDIGNGEWTEGGVRKFLSLAVHPNHPVAMSPYALSIYAKKNDVEVYPTGMKPQDKLFWTSFQPETRAILYAQANGVYNALKSRANKGESDPAWDRVTDYVQRQIDNPDRPESVHLEPKNSSGWSWHLIKRVNRYIASNGIRAIYRTWNAA